MQYTTVLLLALGVTVGASNVHWFVKNNDGKACVIFDADTVTAKLNIIDDNNATKPITFTIGNGTVKGDCYGKYGEENANYVEVSFFPNDQTPKSAIDAQPWRLMLWFTKGADQIAFKLADFVLEAGPAAQFNHSSPQNFTKSAAADVELHATGINGFKCSTSGLALSADSTIELKDTRVIANAILENTTFPSEQTFEQCLLDTRTSDIVPIVVGACLAGLVAVVLVAYLVGRARAKRQGYASV